MIKNILYFGFILLIYSFPIVCLAKKNRPIDKAEQFSIKLKNIPKAKRVDVTIDGKQFTSYMYGDSFEKPFLFPIVAGNGITITRGYPLKPRAGETVDHPHHTGYWFGYGNVNGIDFWGNNKEIPAAEKSKYGNIRFKKIEKLEYLTGRGTLEVDHEWVCPDGSITLIENAKFIFTAGKNFRIIDRITTLTAQLPEVVFQDTKEGAFAIRVARFLDLPSDKPTVFTDAYGKVTSISVQNNKDAKGDYLSSEGVKGAEVWSTRAKWMKMFGVSGSDTVSIVFMDHSSNLNYPTFWHARDYGLFSANPFGQKDFTSGKEILNFKLKNGESVSFRHRLIIKTGNDFTPAEIEMDWKEFSSALNL